jgi:hypothetical protein
MPTGATPAVLATGPPPLGGFGDAARGCGIGAQVADEGGASFHRNQGFAGGMILIPTSMKILGRGYGAARAVPRGFWRARKSVPTLNLP